MYVYDVVRFRPLSLFHSFRLLSSSSAAKLIDCQHREQTSFTNSWLCCFSPLSLYSLTPRCPHLRRHFLFLDKRYMHRVWAAPPLFSLHIFSTDLPKGLCCYQPVTILAQPFITLYNLRAPLSLSLSLFLFPSLSLPSFYFSLLLRLSLALSLFHSFPPASTHLFGSIISPKVLLLYLCLAYKS